MELFIKRLTEEEFAKFAKLIHEESGIFLKDSKITLLSNRLRKRLRVLQLEEFADYFDYLQGLQGDRKKREYEELLDVVSTNETYFFRNERHFNALMQYCIPQLIKNKKDKTLRIWSAACSTGEEPYTIAICIMEKMLELTGWNIEILATDIALSVLEYAKKGDYSGRRIEKVPERLLHKYFIPSKVEPGVYRIKPEVAGLVKFSYLNFFKDAFPRDIDIIFCRNVMIYFDKTHQKELVANFYKVINNEGFLFIGHSETLHTISDDFKYQKIMDSPVYIPKTKE